MKSRVNALCAILLLGVVVLTVAKFLGSKNWAGHEATDLPSLRVELKEQVATGKLTEAEAQVRLAEALATAHRNNGDKVKAVILPELEAVGMKLKERVARGELTEEAAKAAYIEAKTKLLAEAGAKKPPASGISK